MNPIRQALLLAPLLLPAGVLRAQNAPEEIFSGLDKFAAHAKDSSEVTLDKNMLGLAGSVLGKNKDLAGKMDSVVIREYEYAAPGQYRLEDVEEIRKRLDGHGWNHLVRSRETTARGTELTDICTRSDADGSTREMVIIDAEPTELSLIHLRGRLSARELTELGAGLGAPTPPQPPAPPALPEPPAKARGPQ